MDLIKTTQAVIGEDLTIRRALPSKQRRMIGAWCFFDHAGPAHFGPGQGMHVSPHPHIGLQTFTWMMQGELLHRDSLGSEQVIRPGQVNLMTAGRGIAHTEDSVRDGEVVHAAQLWIALPDAQRHDPPAFVHYPELPVLERDGFRITVLVGECLGQKSPVLVHSPLLGLDLQTQGAATISLPLDPSFEHGVLVLEGEAQIDGQLLSLGTLAYFPPGTAELAVRTTANARLLVIGGTPFGKNVLLWWNFVARTQAELETAVADWNAGRGFGLVPGAERPPLKAPALQGVHLKAD